MPTPAPDPKPPAVLMVDDHAPNLLALETVLAPLGARLVAARSGEEALAHVAVEEFALVLLDLRMPGLSGHETARLMNERQHERRPPIIILTAYTLDDNDVRRAYELGVVDILQKPYLPEVLRTKASVFVELFRQRELLRQREAELQTRERERYENELIGIVSHDLRNPLSAILLSATSLAARPGMDERTLTGLARIRSAARRATRLTHDLLDYTRARHERSIPVQPQPANLHDVVREALDELRIEYPTRKIEFESAGDGVGCFDPARVAQVVSNLVSNAVRYSLDDSAISVRSLGDDSRSVLEVHNFGPAIDERERARLFEPMRQGSAGSSTGGSLGLGLFIVAQIVEAHRGRIEVESDERSGTTFRILLPRERAPA